jgi:hypothetical protein
MWTMQDALLILVSLVVGIWAGRRWAYVKHQAECAARNCGTIKQMRKERMEITAESMKISRAHDTIRRAYLQSEASNQSLRISNGMLGKELQALTYQLPRPTRRLVA